MLSLLHIENIAIIEAVDIEFGGGFNVLTGEIYPANVFVDSGMIAHVEYRDLDADLEKNIITSLTNGDHGLYLALSPDVMQSVITQLSEEVKKFQELGIKPLAAGLKSWEPMLKTLWHL